MILFQTALKKIQLRRRDGVNNCRVIIAGY